MKRWISEQVMLLLGQSQVGFATSMMQFTKNWRPDLHPGSHFDPSSNNGHNLSYQSKNKTADCERSELLCLKKFLRQYFRSLLLLLLQVRLCLIWFFVPAFVPLSSNNPINFLRDQDFQRKILSLAPKCFFTYDFFVKLILFRFNSRT